MVKTKQRQWSDPNDFPLEQPDKNWQGAQSDIGTDPKGCGKYTADEVFLRRTGFDTPQGMAPARPGKDIFDAVENQSSDSGNRAVKSGRL
jgi:hypothetical protein